MRHLLFLAVLLFVGCVPPGPEPYDPHTPPVDPDVPPPPKTVTVKDACEHLRDLGCDTTSPAGAECEQWMRNTLERGRDLHLECLVEVDSCDDVDLASQGC